MDNGYFLGLDIGTDSVGYAATDEYYQLKKCKGDPVWGATTFDPGSLAQERRTFRTARRRIDRKQQRVALINEIFAPDISKADPRFFIRRMESRLYREDAGDAFPVFNDNGYTDKEYYDRYPTIHHLICELMSSDMPHDIRLVYLACAWLVVHRGHFLFDVPVEDVGKLLDFGVVYDDFCTYLHTDEYTLPWDNSVTADDILAIMKRNVGVTKKQDAFKADIYGGKKPAKGKDESFPYSRDAIVRLLSGGKVKPSELYDEEAYAEVDSVSLSMPDEDFARIVSELGDNGELLLRLRALQNCATLISTQNGQTAISAAKVQVYEQHKADLAGLKRFVRKYIPAEYNSIFRASGEENYTAYSYNVKSAGEPQKVKRVNAEKFSDFLKRKVKGITPESEDEAFYLDMLTRLETNTFLPKQKTTDNRVIPQQLYRYELAELLKRAEGYLPMLRRRDETGLTASEKILSVFDFRIPYFIGPLNRSSTHAWIERKAEGRIYPWNFKDMVDFDKSEKAFISRMTNYCTYLPGEKVLPLRSLLYCRFTVLNEINNLKINESDIPVDVKQDIFTHIFMERQHVTLKQIENYLRGRGLMKADDTLSGMDVRATSSLSSYHQFKRLLESRTLSEDQVEAIIERAAYSEDKGRFLKWLATEYSQISEEDRKYIARLNLKEFGRMSAYFLNGLLGAEKTTGEAATIIESLWNTNNNLMQLLSERYTFKEAVEEFAHGYYEEHPRTLSERLNEMYISNTVKRQIIRTLDICDDVVKAMGGVPKKIFVEMARGGTPDQNGKRTRTRRQQLEDLYKSIKTDEARALQKELESMGVMADNMLQSEKLFLYYLQMGKCAYTGRAIDLSRLSDGTYNVDHIYPQAFVKDDSLDNKVLVDSNANGAKSDDYPVNADIQARMRPVWESWKKLGLISDEKYRRLIRIHRFTDEERWAFINRQLVETRQSTKTVAVLLKERYPGTEVVYVKAGLVSEFRQEFRLPKCRTVNDLHHAKDAYLNIVVGNVYNARFTKGFNLQQKYNVQVKKIFSNPVRCGKDTVWQGETDVAKVCAVMRKNAAHLTRYSFCRTGGFFDQQPIKAAEGLIPLKQGLPTEKYGGYNKAAAAFFALVRFTAGKKRDIMIMPVELLYADRFRSDSEFAKRYAQDTVRSITGACDSAEILLNGRPLKVYTVLSLDGLLVLIRSKANGGKIINLSSITPLILSSEQEKYIKALVSFIEKRKTNPSIQPDSEHDGISTEQNLALYDTLLEKMGNSLFGKCPGNQAKTLRKGRDQFLNGELSAQIDCLLNIITLLSSAPGNADLSLIGGSKQSGTKTLSSCLSNWKTKYTDVRIVDMSASGIFRSESMNLLELL